MTLSSEMLVSQNFYHPTCDSIEKLDPASRTGPTYLIILVKLVTNSCRWLTRIRTAD